MPDLKKPLTTLELASTVISLGKTAVIVFVMMMLEWSRLKQRKAEVAAGAAENDLAVEKLKNEPKETTSAAEQIDSVLHAHGLPGGTPGQGSNGGSAG